MKCVTTPIYNISPSTGNRGVGPVGFGVTMVTEEVSMKGEDVARGESWEGASGLGERETGERHTEKRSNVTFKKTTTREQRIEMYTYNKCI